MNSDSQVFKLHEVSILDLDKEGSLNLDVDSDDGTKKTALASLSPEKVDS